jgi:uncharacterized protein YjbI with pentapeptide repeats
MKEENKRDERQKSETNATEDAKFNRPDGVISEIDLTDLDKQEQSERIKNLRSANEKLEKEKLLLDLQLSKGRRRKETLQSVAGFGGVVTAFVAIVGLILSSYQWLQNTEASRQTRIEEQLGSTLRQLGDQTEQQRVYAAVLLRTFLTGSDARRDAQVLSAYTNGLAVEKSRAVRNAMLSSLQNLDEKLLRKELLNRALEDLIQANRSLVQEGSLWTTHRDDYSNFAPEDTAEARADSVAAATAILLRKEAKTKDLSGVYLANVDLSGLDLSDVSFERAVLSRANFGKGTLKRSGFNDADLRGTSFVSADLRGAMFKQGSNNYLFRLVQQGKEISGPNFRCADLREASFSGHPLVPLPTFRQIDESGFEVLFHEDGWRFEGSLLDRTNFSEILAFGGIPDDRDPDCPFIFSSVTSVPVRNRNDGLQFFEGVMGESGDKKGSNLCRSDLMIFSGRFNGTNWDAALWPPVLKKWLSEHRPSQEEPECKRRFTLP